MVDVNSGPVVTAERTSRALSVDHARSALPSTHFALLTTQLRFAAIQLTFKPSRFQFFMHTARNLRHPCVRCLRIRRAAAGAVDATSLRRADRATLGRSGTHRPGPGNHGGSRMPTPAPGKSRLIFRLGAISNWLVTVGGIIAPVELSRVMVPTMAPPNYPFLLRLWSGMAFMFGFMFWEISNDPVTKRALIKYSWIEKCVTGTSVTIAWITGNVPLVFFLFVCFPDWLCVPLFAYYDVRMRREPA